VGDLFVSAVRAVPRGQGRPKTAGTGEEES
jgi:hypothetical protein